MTGAFDRALEIRALRSAAEEFALRHGQPGTAEYRLAWVRFCQGRANQDLPEAGPAGNGTERPPSNGRKREDLVYEILRSAIHHAMRIDGAPMANAQLLHPRTQALRLVAQHGFSSEFLDFFKIVDDTTTACGSALERATPVLISDIMDSPVFARTVGLEVMTRAGSRAVASVPITSPTGRVLGMISTHHPQATTWTDRRRVGLQDLCRSTGHVLHQALTQRAKSA